MKHVSILVPRGNVNFITIITTFKLFVMINDYVYSIKKKYPFTVDLVAETAKVSNASSAFIVVPTASIDTIKRTDLIIIPAADLAHPRFENESSFREFIVDHHAKGAEVASLCTGAFLLASTGLLDQRQCSTHWKVADKFRSCFPSVTLLPEKIITDEAGLYTNGGGFSFLNLLLHLVEKYCNREMAVYCAKVLEVDIERNSQSPFIIFSGQKNHNDEQIIIAQNEIEKNVTSKPSVEELARKIGLSKRNFERRFKKATGNTPIEYIQRVRIEYAKRRLETEHNNIDQVMYETGYSDRKAFRTAFKRLTGLLPLDYRKKYQAISLQG